LDRFPLAVPLAVVAAVVYWAATAQMLSASQLYGHYNLAFDFDPSRYINLDTSGNLNFTDFDREISQ
jgi:dipeptide/tripeptide permease